MPTFYSPSSSFAVFGDTDALEGALQQAQLSALAALPPAISQVWFSGDYAPSRFTGTIQDVASEPVQAYSAANPPRVGETVRVGRLNPDNYTRSTNPDGLGWNSDMRAFEHELGVVEQMASRGRGAAVRGASRDDFFYFRFEDLMPANAPVTASTSSPPATTFVPGDRVYIPPEMVLDSSLRQVLDSNWGGSCRGLELVVESVTYDNSTVAVVPVDGVHRRRHVSPNILRRLDAKVAKRLKALRSLEAKIVTWNSPFAVRHSRRRVHEYNFSMIRHAIAHYKAATTDAARIEAARVLTNNVTSAYWERMKHPVGKLAVALHKQQMRFVARSGEEKVVWVRPKFGTAGDVDPLCYLDYNLNELHGVHNSVTDPRMIAYTPSVDYLLAGREIKVKPGKYLTKFLGPGSDNERFTELQIKGFAEFHAAASGPATMMVGTTTADFIRVIGEGPSESCMSNRFSGRGEKWFVGHVHPAAAYNDEDFEILYTEVAGRITSRVLANKKTKALSRAYGDYERLLAAAKDAGYTQQRNALVGLRMNKIRSGCTPGWIMPYVDGGTQSGGGSLDVRDDGEYWVLTPDDDGEHSTYRGYEGNGVLREGDDDEDEDNDEYCECCESNVREVFTAWRVGEPVSVCEECRGAHYSYARSAYNGRVVHRYVNDDEVVWVNGEAYDSDSDALSVNNIGLCEFTGDYHPMDDLVECTAGRHVGEYILSGLSEEDAVTGEIAHESEFVTTVDGHVFDDNRVTCQLSGNHVHRDHCTTIDLPAGEFVFDLRELSEVNLHEFVQCGDLLLPAGYYGVALTSAFEPTNVNYGGEVSMDVRERLEDLDLEELEAA